MADTIHTIIYTQTDEAPALATASLLPVIEAFTKVAGVEVELRDISLAGRVLASFPDFLSAEQQVSDDLAELGTLVQQPEANVIKLPNISASIPQLKATIEELRAKGLLVPEFPDEPSTDDERSIRARYDKIKGSAVNPVLREGNSDRRAPASVKHYARSHPHSMGAWAPDSQHARRAHGRRRLPLQRAVGHHRRGGSLRVELVGDDGAVTVLKESIPVLAGEVVDATVMRAAALDAFLAEQLEVARANGILFSVHLKATMMKVSDPDHLRARGEGVLRGGVRQARRGVRVDRVRRRQRHGRPPRAPRRGPCRDRAPRSKPTSRPHSSPARHWRWSTRTRASPTSTCRAT